MSRIGKQKIEIPEGVKVNIETEKVRVEGPRGVLETPVPKQIRVQMDGAELTAHRDTEGREVRSLHGLTRALLSNAVIGVSQGFQKELDVVGIGFRAEVKGKSLSLVLGFSHEVNFQIPERIEIKVTKVQKQLTNYIGTITVSGNDKQQVGQVAADIRAFRKPDAYKGKGIRYSDEIVRTKVGKKGV